MGTVAVTPNITMDGSIEFLGDWFDPTADQSDQLELLHEQSARSDALLVGRKTFEDFRSYWPAGCSRTAARRPTSGSWPPARSAQASSTAGTARTDVRPGR